MGHPGGEAKKATISKQILLLVVAPAILLLAASYGFLSDPRVGGPAGAWVVFLVLRWPLKSAVLLLLVVPIVSRVYLASAMSDRSWLFSEQRRSLVQAANRLKMSAQGSAADEFDTAVAELLAPEHWIHGLFSPRALVPGVGYYMPCVASAGVGIGVGMVAQASGLGDRRRALKESVALCLEAYADVERLILKTDPDSSAALALSGIAHAGQAFLLSDDQGFFRSRRRLNNMLTVAEIAKELLAERGNAHPRSLRPMSDDVF